MKQLFVGWMGLPRDHHRFYSIGIAILVVADLCLGALLFAAQPPHRSGSWYAGGELTFEGALVTHPYPILRIPAAPGRPAQSILLVDEWKFGLPPGSDLKDGEPVRAQGYLIEREDVRVLQIDQRLVKVDTILPAVAPLQAVATKVLTGEIVDGKCWAGAMNPGDGRAHRGCGSLCLLGNIPALFVVEAQDGTTRWYILADDTGKALGEGLRARIGERLTLGGQVLDAPDLHVFQVNPNALAE